MRITPPYWAWLFCSVISNNSFLLSRKSIIQSDWYHGDSGQLVEHLGGGHQDDRARADHCYVQIKAIVRENQVFSRNKQIFYLNGKSLQKVLFCNCFHFQGYIHYAVIAGPHYTTQVPRILQINNILYLDSKEGGGRFLFEN